MADNDVNLESEEMSISSDSEDEKIASLIDEDDDDEGVRYSLRSRAIPKAGAATSETSAAVKDTAELRAISTSSDTRTTADTLYTSGDRTTGTDIRAQIQHTITHAHAHSHKPFNISMYIAIYSVCVHAGVSTEP